MLNKIGSQKAQSIRVAQYGIHTGCGFFTFFYLKFITPASAQVV
jgi:hypothetical protein